VTPPVTVLLPVHNGERFVGEAVAGILAQTWRDFELIVVDDASTDDTARIVASTGDPRVTLLRMPVQAGVAASLNEGLRVAHGEFVARQDADDVSLPLRLERQLDAFAADPSLALVGTRAERIDEHGRSLGTVERSLEDVSIRWYGLLDNPMIHTSVMFRRATVWDALGGYDAAAYPLSQDFALWSRVVRAHRAANLADRLVRYRVLPTSVSNTQAIDAAGLPSTRFAAIVRRIVGENVRAFFDSEICPEADVELLAGFVLGVPRESLDRFLLVFTRLLAEYTRRYPDAARSRDFARTVARQMDAIAFRVRPPSREAAWRVYRRALAGSPGVALDLPWLRAASLLLFGRGGRAWLRRMRSTMAGVA
jgi:glycosyltransferase involved in cell wall biosynthesis